jgi:hypothetical protein
MERVPKSMAIEMVIQAVIALATAANAFIIYRQLSGLRDQVRDEYRRDLVV